MANAAFDDGKAALNEFLEQRWWLLALRGLFGVIFGIICFASPAIAAFSLLILFGAWSLVDGAFGLFASYGQAKRGERWVWLAVEAVANIVIGVLVLTMPALSFVALLLVIGIKALISGLLLLFASVKLDGDHGQGFLVVAGLVNLAFAALIFLAPVLGVKIIVWWIGVWSILFGVALIALGFKLKSFAGKVAAS
ncbi:DUF308 domain-containing protein [Sandaracinobacter sp. RS1-74]|uniref:HdeD family acid-resistance protein n=1 Tax=Sandaracinobacteroides sayramensis TaxID=2913411 RepID=UPI001EDC0CF4|nr:DUF308 domain-containing protein [Sandaracinobacteroides sayramensis]MCG2842237.1 DUF308 domain-containing protein [Sandaracinobacteroides sayramensis]